MQSKKNSQSSNVKNHPKHLPLAIAIFIVCSIIFTFNLWFQGLKNTYTTYTANDGKIVILATSDSAATNEEIVQDITTHGGNIIGVDSYGEYGLISLPADFVNIDTSQAPTSTIPVLASPLLAAQLSPTATAPNSTTLEQKIELYRNYRQQFIGQTFLDTNDEQYHIIDTSRGAFYLDNMSFQQLDSQNFNLLNSFLQSIPTPHSESIAINKTTSQITNTGDYVLAYFNDPQTAYNYFLNGQGEFRSASLHETQYQVKVLLGTPPDIEYIFKSYQTIADIVSAILVVAIIISILYASRHQTNNIMPLTITAITTAFILATILVMSFSLINQKILSNQAILAFSLPNPPTIIWYGINPEIVITAATILLAALLGTKTKRKKAQSKTRQP